jgi:hypothetical protein
MVTFVFNKIISWLLALCSALFESSQSRSQMFEKMRRIAFVVFLLALPKLVAAERQQ